jgi:hypothetical protein
MKKWLIDTGPFIAYFSRSDPMHGTVASVIDGFSGHLLSTSAVITEAMYFLSDAPDGPSVLAEFLLGSGIRIVESTQPEQVVAATALMAKYSDAPMDFADATLVLLADEASVTDILTLDRRGFSTYRTARGKTFRLILKK